MKFLGHIVSEGCIRPDPDKIKAMLALPRPTTLTQLRKLLGMVTYHLKFLPQIQDVIEPLRELVKAGSDKLPDWGEKHSNAFQKIKQMLTQTPVLALYNPNSETRISADASAYGVGAMLEQRQGDGDWKPVHYASRTLTPTERRYAQIEKEALALTWACERFSNYVLGINELCLRTDHKPLVALLKTKAIGDLSARIQRFRMRLVPFQYEMEHVAGDQFYTPDLLSRGPLETHEPDIDIIEDDIDKLHCLQVVQSLPMSDERLKEVAEAQKVDQLTQRLITLVLKGWPKRQCDFPRELRPYFPYRDTLNVAEGLLMKGLRIYIPKEMQREILGKIHQGHLGITKCRERAKASVWWLGISGHIKDVVQNCTQCLEHRTNPVEPLMPTEPTVRPWQQVGADLMTWGNMSYLIVVDYYSSYPEVVTLMGTTSAAITCHLKGIFARHGIPETMRTDNGPQFQGEDFRKFCRTWGIKHVTSSPGFPQSNGKVESAVKIIKNIIKKEKDLWLGILAYRASPLLGEKSPSELLMGRRLRTTIPTSTEQLLPQWSQNINESRRRWNRRTSMKRWFDNRHKARELPELAIGSRVFIKDLKRYGTVREKLLEPRSYRVNISSGVVRRNRAQLILVPKEERGKQDETRNPLYSFRTEQDAGGETHPAPGSAEIDRQPVKTRFGRVSRPTRRFSPC